MGEEGLVIGVGGGVVFFGEGLGAFFVTREDAFEFGAAHGFDCFGVEGGDHAATDDAEAVGGFLFTHGKTVVNGQRF